MTKFSPLREELRRAWIELRGSELSAAHVSASVAIGLFIGSQPFFGFHTVLVLIVCLWFRLDAAVAWVFANISNPLFAPALLTAEVQIGAFVITGALLDRKSAFAIVGGRPHFDFVGLGELAGLAGHYAAYWFVGAALVGLALAVLGGSFTYVVVALKQRLSRESGRRYVAPYRLPDNAPPWVQAVERVAARYIPPHRATHAERTRFHYVRLKLLSDPVAKLIASVGGDRPNALGEVLDIGTGAGQLPILLLELGRATRVRGVDWHRTKIESAERARAGSPGIAVTSLDMPPPSSATPSEPGSSLGVASLPAEFWCADARQAELGEADTVLLIDLLHYVRVEEQDAILRRAAAAVRPGGRLLVREADTEQGWRSLVTLFEERLFTALRFNRGERVRFRPIREMVAILEGMGLSCETRPAWGKTPFSNMLIIASRPPDIQ